MLRMSSSAAEFRDEKSEAAMTHALHQKSRGGRWPKPLTPENLVEEAKKTLAVFNVTGLLSPSGPGESRRL